MIRTIVEEAAKHDLRVFAHITSLDELRAALEGGAAGVVHTVWDRPFPETGLADRTAAGSFYVVPTTSLYRGTVSLRDFDEPIDLDDPFLRETVSGKEVASLRDRDFIAGFRSGWQRPLASDENRERTIEPGKRADLLILGANPLDDIRNTRSLEVVVAGGRVVDRDALPVRIPRAARPRRAADGAWRRSR